jgi:hypothetical protein
VQNEAFSPSQIVTLLKPMTKMMEDMDPITKRPYKVMVEMPDVDPKTGEQVMTRPPRGSREANEGVAGSVWQPLQERSGQRDRVGGGNRRPAAGEWSR